MQEIAMYILDIAYNCIRAKAKHIQILIEDSIKKNEIDIQIIDDGCGMDENTLQKVIDPFYTTRTTRQVGLGVPMFKESVEATEGTFEIVSKLNQGTSVKACYVKDHLDTPPMGDIIETMMTLILADQSIDYVFQYKEDNHEFVLNTKEVKELLDGVPINQPEIIFWLKEYIKEGLQL